MLFDSFEFALFLPVVFVTYWLLKRTSQRRILLLISSYIFYASWDFRFLGLIVFSSIADYVIALKIGQLSATNRRKILLLISVFANLGLLFFFKYFNFFLESFQEVFRLFGSPIHDSTINIILPVGISFYTFQTLGYTIDVYKRRILPERNPITFLCYVAYFPQLVAGPIERAGNLIPQFNKQKHFDLDGVKTGLRQILWGLFKKVVIADNLGDLVDACFNSPENYSGPMLFTAASLFAFQIYCDFSGYSDIAIGTSRLFGISLMQNFKTPYFATNIVDFWRRWHISLSTWFRDYLYIPLGGNRLSFKNTLRNIFLVFVVSGIWHGANWTFVMWGVIHAVFFALYLVSEKRSDNWRYEFQGFFGKFLKSILGLVLTYSIVTLAWIFFRSDSLSDSIIYLNTMLSIQHFYFTDFEQFFIENKFLLITLFLFILTEWITQKEEFALERTIKKYPVVLRWLIYSLIMVLIGLFVKSDHAPFIYFQF